MSYIRRIVDDELDELLPALPAIALEGPKAVGKTATAERRAASMRRLDDPAELQLAEAEPARLTTGRRPVLLDEWQRFPSSWDLVRRAVDRDGSPGQFLLTGSAVPLDTPTHTGTGRIATLRMRPLALAERGLETPTVSLKSLLSGQRPPIVGTTARTLADYASEIVGSGFPAIRTLHGRAQRAQLDGYLERIAERDFEELGRRVRKEGGAQAVDGRIRGGELDDSFVRNSQGCRHVRSRRSTSKVNGDPIPVGP